MTLVAASGEESAVASHVESGVLARSDAGLARFLIRLAPVSIVFLFAVFVLPYLAGMLDRSLAGVGLVISAAACGLSLALTESGAARRVFISLFAISLAVHLFAMAVIVSFQSPPGSIYLGPDGGVFWLYSEALATAGLRLDAPFTQLGSFDVAHYYVFAATLLAFGGGLASLQLLNLAATALIGSIVYTIARRTLPRYAVITGVVVALHPSLTALSVVDLLKDPLIALATALVFGAIAALVARPSWPKAVCLALVATVAVLFLRMDRFYMVVMLQGSVAAAAGLVVLRWRSWKHTHLRTAATIALVLLIGEVAPLAFGSRLSSELFIANVQHVGYTAAMKDYAPGLLNRDNETVAGETPSASNETPSAGVPTRPSTGESTKGDRLFNPAPKILVYVVDALRRIFGPFVWVPPSDYRLEALSAKDFFYYPGTLLWYVVAPFLVIGVATVLWRAMRRQPVPFVLLTLALFTVAYGAAYMGINLSYRHREVMMPILFLFVPYGFVSGIRHRLVRPLYLSYVAGLTVMALTDIVAHRLL